MHRLTYHNPPLPVETEFASFQWPKYAWTLPKGTPASRLKKAKLHPPICGEYQIAFRPLSVGSAGLSFYLGSDFMPGLRWRWADDVTRLGHKGWYCDQFQDQTIRGLVFRLPHGRGFLPAWSMGDSMASAVDYSRTYETEEDAALAADSWAERVAEEEREYQEKEQARLDAEEAEREASLAHDAACRDIQTVNS